MSNDTIVIMFSGVDYSFYLKTNASISRVTAAVKELKKAPFFTVEDVVDALKISGFNAEKVSPCTPDITYDESEK